MQPIYLVPGLRTPFVKAGTHFAAQDTLDLSKPVISAMAARARPDLVIWGQVIPSTRVSNIGRELVQEAGLDPSIPGSTTVLACSTSMMAAIQASGMLGRGGRHLALVGGVETMSHVPIALHPAVAQRIAALALKDQAAAIAALADLSAADFALPMGWANRVSGRSMGEHTEDTVKRFHITRHDQDRIAYDSHARAVAARDAGFYDDLVLPFGAVTQDALPRRDTSLEKLARLAPVFDRSAAGSITAGNASPNTDGAAGLWVADAVGLARLGSPGVALVDWEIAAMDYHEEGILMAPGRAVPRLLARNGLRLPDIALWEIHEAFAGQVLANIAAFSDPAYRREKAGVDQDLGAFPWDRLNPNGGSIALGHPFGATGARILSQAAKELLAAPPGSHALVSICADGGQGTACLLRKPIGQ